MSQLVVRPGRNAARQAKKLKEIRKVKNAIQWHERERKKRQALKQENWEFKQAVLGRIRWEHEHVKGVRKRALANAKEDWKLGPLRPNRAVGPDAEKYGALTGVQVQKPEIPIKMQKSRNAVREKKGLELEYPLVVDDKKYFPIVKDDRVVILKGKDAGKIGVVREIVERTHDVIVKGMNMQYYDTNVFNAAAEAMGPKIENEVPMSLSNVRLVVPAEIDQGSQKRYEDVVVEKIDMERHTTGIDPYTGTDYGNDTIPEAHQYDPRTGLPIFHRYIAGTRQRLEWPWEREDDIEDVGITKESDTDKQTLIRRALGKVSQPFTSLSRWRSKNKEDQAQQDATNSRSPVDVEARFAEIQRQEQERFKSTAPISIDPELPSAYDVDTRRNIVEGSESMAYTLVAPPFPDTLGEELRGDIHEFSIKAKKDRDPEAPRPIKIAKHSEQGVLAREITKQQHRAAQAMKTPMQLRWELEHQKKVRSQKEKPLVDQESLLAALGQHMQKSATKPYLGKKQIPSQTADLD
ncbi:KOW motif domain-containing protein [Alternaria rosae]|uniref:KOW motif domain-containing protein n=1 Tax=Alternaria rosae TaxID=1187941 RepID=UPI001E8E6E72|nr:KOW motif domain-containing protein [Alternaria rosae]KAH6875923.1 KOW motif domain-containing protein [Alternaria rosae]